MIIQSTPTLWSTPLRAEIARPIAVDPITLDTWVDGHKKEVKLAAAAGGALIGGAALSAATAGAGAGIGMLEGAVVFGVGGAAALGFTLGAIGWKLGDNPNSRGLGMFAGFMAGAAIGGVSGVVGGAIAGARIGSGYGNALGVGAGAIAGGVAGYLAARHAVH